MTAPDSGKQQYEEEERMKMLKSFDESNAGVKSLLDSGLRKIPEIFLMRPSDEPTHETSGTQVPVIDLLGRAQDPETRRRVVGRVRDPSRTWGFFQVVNHGIPQAVLDRMIGGVRRFNEMDVEEKKRYYTRDSKRSVKFNSNYDLYGSTAANWRDTLSFPSPDRMDIQELPDSCRESTIEYWKHVAELGSTLLELLSEALGLNTDHLHRLECLKGARFSCHYYLACPEPHLTIGATKHSDIGLLTILLQNQINRLQVLHQGQWVNVEPNLGALIVNIGDLLQQQPQSVGPEHWTKNFCGMFFLWATV